MDGPFSERQFHLGVHNLPGARAQEWMDELKACTASPAGAHLRPAEHAARDSEVLVVFNHPLWNLYANLPPNLRATSRTSSPLTRPPARI